MGQWLCSALRELKCKTCIPIALAPKISASRLSPIIRAFSAWVAVFSSATSKILGWGFL